MTRFEIRSPYIIFHDDKPGQCATLAVSGEAFPFRNEASSFDDQNRIYAWAFEGIAKEGTTVTFSTDDRQVSGTVRGGEIVVGGALLEEIPPAPPDKYLTMEDLAPLAGEQAPVTSVHKAPHKATHKASNKGSHKKKPKK